MTPNTRTATAGDYDRAAARQAGSAWFWFVVSGVMAFFWSWWAIIPATLVVYRVVSGVAMTRQAQRLRAGTYQFPNPNNGAPDGDARNLETFSARAETIWQRFAQHGISVQDFARYDSANPNDARRVFAEFELDDPARWARAAERIKAVLARLPAP